MEYIGIGINDSATIAMRAAEELSECRGLAVKFDDDGKGVICGAGETAIGILIAEHDDVPEDGQMDVCVKDMTFWKAGADFSAGAELASDGDGKAVEAGSGDFVLAVALEAAKENDMAWVQICKYVSGGSSGSTGNDEP